MMKTLKYILATAVIATGMTACHNGDNEFPDFDYQAVYFATQNVGRTVELGNDYEIDLTSDNNHQVVIKAVMGGAYKNTKNRIIDIEVDPTMIENMYFANGGAKVELLPADYYTLSGQTITIPSGSIDGGVTVQLNDNFFNDPKAIDFTYVIPVKMTAVQGDVKILEKRNYTLYFLRYVNEWHGQYLRRGNDKITAADGTVNEVKRQNEYIERDEEVTANTSAYRQVDVALSTQTDGDHKYSYKLRLKFSDDKKTCTIESADGTATITGTGKWVEKDATYAFNNRNRDTLYLEYTVESNDGWKLETSDVMVMRNRNVTAVNPEVETK